MKSSALRGRMRGEELGHLAYLGQKDRTIVLQLALPYPVNQEKLLRGAGFEMTHVLKGAVAKDHIRREVLFFGQAIAKSLEGLEEVIRGRDGA